MFKFNTTIYEKHIFAWQGKNLRSKVLMKIIIKIMAKKINLDFDLESFLDFKDPLLE